MTSEEVSWKGAATPLAATFAVQTLAAMVLFGVAVIAPVAAADMGVDPTLIGTFTAIVYCFGMMAGLLTGAATDRYGAIRICQATMVFALLGTAVLTLSTPIAAIASAALIGLCYGPVNPASTHILARVSPERWRPMIFSIKQTGMPAGSAAAGVLLPLLIVAYDWRVAIATTGVLALLVAIFVQPLRPRLDTIRDGKRRLRIGDIVEPLKLVWREGDLRCLAIVSFTYSGCQVAITVFYVVYLTTVMEMSITVAGLMFTLLQIGAVIGRLLWGSVADSVFPANLVLAWLGIATAVLSLVVGSFAPGWLVWAVGLVSFVMGITSSGWNGVFFSELVKYSPADETGEAASGVQFVIMAGVMTMPPLFGLLVTASGGYFWAFAATGLGMFAAAIYLMVRTRNR